MLKFIYGSLLYKAAIALTLVDSDFSCDVMQEVEGPIIVSESGRVIENMIIYGEPGDDTGENDVTLKLERWVHDVTIKNVTIYHAANTQGIYGQFNDNLTIENVKVVAYGNDWGTSPCPTRFPFKGSNCQNIQLRRANNLKMTNVTMENGSGSL